MVGKTDEVSKMKMYQKTHVLVGKLVLCKERKLQIRLAYTCFVLARSTFFVGMHIREY